MSHLMKWLVPAAVLGLVLGAAGQAKAALTFSANPVANAIEVRIIDLVDSANIFRGITYTVGGGHQSLPSFRLARLLLSRSLRT